MDNDACDIYGLYYSTILYCRLPAVTYKLKSHTAFNPHVYNNTLSIPTVVTAVTAALWALWGSYSPSALKSLVLTSGLQSVFDTLCMDISGSEVDILTVCPGCVMSQGSTNTFTKHLNSQNLVTNLYAESAFLCYQLMYCHLLAVFNPVHT